MSWSFLYIFLPDTNEPEKASSIKNPHPHNLPTMQNLWSAWWSEGQSFWVGAELGLWWIKPPASEGTVIFTWKMASAHPSVLICSWTCLFFQVPNDLLEQAKAAAQAALEEMDAD